MEHRNALPRVFFAIRFNVSRRVAVSVRVHAWHFVDGQRTEMVVAGSQRNSSFVAETSSGILGGVPSLVELGLLTYRECVPESRKSILDLLPDWRARALRNSAGALS